MSICRYAVSSMDKFHSATTNCYAWKQRFENYVVLLDLPDQKKANVLVESLVRKALETLYSVCRPEKILKFPADQLIWKLNKLCQKQTSKHYERSKFFRLSLESGETLVNFAHRLREKSMACELGEAVLVEMLLAAFFWRNIKGKDITVSVC